jgi:hypothetical protein
MLVAVTAPVESGRPWVVRHWPTLTALAVADAVVVHVVEPEVVTSTGVVEV